MQRQREGEGVIVSIHCSYCGNDLTNFFKIEKEDADITLKCDKDAICDICNKFEPALIDKEYNPYNYKEYSKRIKMPTN